jgi:hypothetical protein
VLKQASMSGIVYLIIAVFFMTSAIGRTISNDAIIINVQWFCSVVFASLGIWHLSKSAKPKTRFKKLDEFYKAIDVLIERLNAEGYPGDAQRLNTLIHGTAWTTGSELLGELMLALKDMKGNYSHELRNEINECFEFALHHRKILGLGDGRQGTF